MFKLSQLRLPTQFTQTKMKAILALVIKVLCLVMLLMSGTPRICILTHTGWLTKSAKSWQAKDTQERFPGCVQTANLK